jgi:hypothetical protein
MRRVYLLSPASTSGERARILLRDEARLPLAMRLRGEGAPLGEVFAFLSGLYFRGKLTYARAFAEHGPARIITATRGLMPLDAVATRALLLEFAEVDIHHECERFTKPLARDAKKLRREIGDGDDEIVLLGSIASKKYVDTLARVFGERLVFPTDFVGRGDMSRGGLLLRAARAGQELAYAPVAGAVRRGTRPPKLLRVPGILKSVTPREAK